MTWRRNKLKGDKVCFPKYGDFTQQKRVSGLLLAWIGKLLHLHAAHGG